MSARSPIPAPPYHGGCLCGALRFRLDRRPDGVNACHCTDCKRLTGATHLLMLLARRADFHVEQGESVCFEKRADSGRIVAIYRCARCGVRLWHEPRSASELIFIAAGTLDDPIWAEPASHIWTSRRSPGVEIQADAYQHPAQPETREGIIEAFARLYPVSQK